MADLTSTGCCDSQPPIGSPQSVSGASLNKVEQLAWALNEIRKQGVLIADLTKEVNNLKLRALQDVDIDFGTQQVTGTTVANERKTL